MGPGGGGLSHEQWWSGPLLRALGTLASASAVLALQLLLHSRQVMQLVELRRRHTAVRT